VIMPNGGRGVPARWENYSNIGKVLTGTRFIPFKVPLNDNLLAQVPEGTDNTWGLAKLKTTCPQLKHIIDLTATHRYYDRYEAIAMGFNHVKILTEGHKVPKPAVVLKFFSAVDNALAQDETSYVGVHCTHGLNRTGYLICRYMVEKLGFEPSEAIRLFDEARGHKQERENYIDHLKKLNNEVANDEGNEAGELEVNGEQEVNGEKANETYGEYRRRKAEEEYKRRKAEEEAHNKTESSNSKEDAEKDRRRKSKHKHKHKSKRWKDREKVDSHNSERASHRENTHSSHSWPSSNQGGFPNTSGGPHSSFENHNRERWGRGGNRYNSNQGNSFNQRPLGPPHTRDYHSNEYREDRSGGRGRYSNPYSWSRDGGQGSWNGPPGFGRGGATAPPFGRGGFRGHQNSWRHENRSNDSHQSSRETNSDQRESASSTQRHSSAKRSNERSTYSDESSSKKRKKKAPPIQSEGGIFI